MRIVIDEDLPRSLGESLGKLGWEVYDIRDCGLRGKPDKAIMRFAIRRKAVLLSGDFDFANILDFPTESHYGVIILHFPNELSNDFFIKEATKSLKILSQRTIKHKLVIIEPGKIRIRS